MILLQLAAAVSAAAAAVAGRSDTATLTIAAAAPIDLLAGIPFGPYRLVAGTTSAPFTLTAGFNSPSTIVSQINDARARKVSILLAMTGGAHRAANHGCCLAVINGVLQFDRAGWDATMAKFNTPAIRQAIAAGVADGTIVGASVMDEPFVQGAGDGNTWGPPGTMTKARVDPLCGEVKRYFPTLPAGVEHQHNLFEPTKSYRVCDFIVDQYMVRMGDVLLWRDAGLAMAARDHHAIIFSLNVLDGGIQDKDGTWDCTGTGGTGTYSPNCRMTPAQLATFGQAIGPKGCALLLWEYDADWLTLAAAPLRALATTLAAAPRRRCVRW